MATLAAAIGIAASVGGLVYLGLHFGSRFVDDQFLADIVQPDPDRPILAPPSRELNPQERA